MSKAVLALIATALIAGCTLPPVRSAQFMDQELVQERVCILKAAIDVNGQPTRMALHAGVQVCINQSSVYTVRYAYSAYGRSLAISPEQLIVRARDQALEDVAARVTHCLRLGVAKKDLVDKCPMDDQRV